MTVRIVPDTCVWLNLAGDYRHLPLLNMMHAMVEEEEIEFFVPDIVLDEFNRNKERVLKASKTSQKENFKRVRGTIKQFGTGDTEAILAGILDVEQKLHMHADAVDETMEAVTTLMAGARQVVPSTVARSRAATRGMDFAAPFNRNRNGIADAVILETYFELYEERGDNGDRFAFVSSNTTDFTDATIDKRKPHKDIETYFDGVDSVFATDIGEYFNNLMIDLDPHGVFEDYYLPEDPRVASEITAAIDLLWDQVWYTRHLYYMAEIDRGDVQVVDEMPKSKPYDQTKVTKANLSTFRAAGERVREKYKDRPEVLGPFPDFEWGMVNGKLSALRWVMGDEWDFLDT